MEQGFSINKEILCENLSNESLIGQRQVYDAITYYGGIEKIKIDKKLIHASRNARENYVEALRKKKEKHNETEMRRAQKRENTEKVKELEKKKQNIIQNARNEAAELDAEIKKLI